MMERQGNHSLPFHSREKVNEALIINKIISGIVLNWRWFAFSLLLALLIAFMVNRYSKPIYEASTLILLETDRSQKSPGGTESLGSGVFEGLGMTGSMRNINNQTVVLSSTPIIEGALDELDFEVSYFSEGRIGVTERYKEVPFVVEWDKRHVQPVGLPFKLHIGTDGKLTINGTAKEVMLYDYNLKQGIRRIPELTVSGTVMPDSLFESGDYAFKIILNDRFDPKASNEYRFVFNSSQSLLFKYKSRVSIIPSVKESSILEVIVRDNNVTKAIDFLNKLAEIYQRDNLAQKNKNAQRTMDFISSQLRNISDSLWISENELQQFQTKTNVMDISYQSQQLIGQMNELDKERAELLNKDKYYSSLKDYINNGQNLESIIAPSAIGIADPLLNNLISDLNKLEVTKSTMTYIKDPDHPKLRAINSQIESIKNSMLENANNILSQSRIALDNLNSRLGRVQALVNSLPATERNYVTIERKYKLNSETYNFLLEKYSEAQIAKASNFPDSQVIESASYRRLVSPISGRNYGIAFLLGLLLPGSIIFLKEFLSSRISSEEDIKSFTSLPIIGYIFQNTKENSSQTLLLDDPNSPACEPYRAVRGRLNLISGEKEKLVIAVTSSFSQEGKTYNAINIATSFALLKKKTVLLDLDLRNSKIRRIFGIRSDEGVVNYIDGKSTLADITFNSKHPYLSLVPAGPVASNPGEMLADDKIIRLLHELKEQFDVIIIDNLPVGLFADLFHLRDEIDVTVFVVRHQFTHHEAMKTALAEVAANKMKGVGILINYIKQSRRNFGYGHNYGYIYGYAYTNNGLKNSEKRLFNKEKNGGGVVIPTFLKSHLGLVIPAAIIFLLIPVYLVIRGNKMQITEQEFKPASTPVHLSDTTLQSRAATNLHDSVLAATANSVSVPSREDLFYLIGGSFSTQQKANEFFNKMSDKGYHPLHLGQVGNYFRVALNAFSTKRDADLAVIRLKDTTDIQDAWIYHPVN